MVKKKQGKKNKKPAGKVSIAESIGKKQFRLSDWIAEKTIKTMAFGSIAFVALIFIFVFRETLPLFSDLKNGLNSAAETGDGSGPEVYAPDVYSPEVYSPEVYSPDVYSPDDADLPAAATVEEITGKVAGESSSGETGLRPETYDPFAGEEAATSAESADVADLRPDVYSPYEEVITERGEDYLSGVEASAYVSSAGSENAQARATLFSRDWQPVSMNPRYGILPLIAGTLKVTLIAMLFAAPIAILAALYTSVFAPKRIREYIKPAIELLAGFPSVVIGFFALMILASFFQDIFGYATRLNALVGGIAMGLAAIPVIYTISEDALTAVPKTYTEASLGLGASERQTAFKVVLPAATPGIFAAILLGVGRVFGETMIALMATGNAALMTISPFDPVRTLSATIGAEMAEVVFGDTHYSVLFLIGSLLFIFTFTLNAIAEFYFKKRVLRRIQGKQA